MSVNQWKLLNQIREYISKLNDKSAQVVIQKELQYIAKRIPDLQKDFLKYFDYNEKKEIIQQTEPVIQSPPESNYNLPNVLKKKSNLPEVPKWKTTTTTVISKVESVLLILCVI